MVSPLERHIEIIMLGDGLSGKTTLLRAMATEIAQDEYQVYLGRHAQKISEQSTHLDIEQALLTNEEFITHLQHENRSLYDFLTKDMSLGTVGIESFNLKWHQSDSEVVHLKGYDLGGQRIYDHLRRVLTGLATPTTRLITVFDISRRLSCEQSLQQMLGQLSHLERVLSPENPLIIVFNKVDLREFLKSPTVQDTITTELLSQIESRFKDSGITITVPSILNPNKTISVKIPKRPYIGFELFEALVYDLLNRHVIPKNRQVMTDENARAMAREMSFHFLLESRSMAPEHSQLRPIEELEQIVFSERPLAVQYLKNLVLHSDKKQLSTDDLLRLLRMKMTGFEIPTRVITSEKIKKILNSIVNVEDVITRVKQLNNTEIFKTNALQHQGVKELLQHLLQFNKKIHIKEMTKRPVHHLTRM